MVVLAMKVYCIELEGQGDKEIKLVGEEVFNWITSTNLGRPDGCQDTGWIDQTTPKEVKDYLAPHSDKPYITIGSPNNDRALLAPAVVIDGVTALFFHTSELVDFCKNHDCEIANSFEGCIY